MYELTRLIRFALEDARARGLAVLPFCPFAASWLLGREA
jgi:predicted GNAT family acetyltransferase